MKADGRPSLYFVLRAPNDELTARIYRLYIPVQKLYLDVFLHINRVVHVRVKRDLQLFAFVLAWLVPALPVESPVHQELRAALLSDKFCPLHRSHRLLLLTDRNAECRRRHHHRATGQKYTEHMPSAWPRLAGALLAVLLLEYPLGITGSL